MEENASIVLSESLEVVAETGNLHKVLDFVEEHLDACGCKVRAKMQLILAVEEIYVNIAHYAYKPGKGPVTIHLEIRKDPAQAKITFIDQGVPYDPLAKKDPDISLPLDKRQVGGLGIYITKKNVDDIEYEHIDGKNMLTLIKNI